jgi:mono/diheme cytochrome c family protein
MRGYVLFFALASAGLGQTPEFYESTVRPILTTNCAPCHNDKIRTSGLSVTSVPALIAGGNRGPSVKAGSPNESILLSAILHSGDLKMPPGRRLKDEQIDVIRRWIEAGAPAPKQEAAAARPASNHWAFQPPKKAQLPAVRAASWSANPIDRFILARLEKENLTPSPEAPRATLLRRVTLDLTGLLPTPNEIDEFLADTQPGAYDRVVERLLASPHYGERWGRHWLDVARYADSHGYTIDAPRQIWKYRDWVIDAVNRDMPFDRFVIEQMAGDLLPNPTTSQLIATGFQRNTSLNFEGGIDWEQYRVEAVVDRVATTGAAFLGMTLGCARCHDHKYDPISQREFYQLYAFFNNIDEIDSEKDRNHFEKPVLELGTPEELARAAAWKAQTAALETELAAYRASLPAGNKAAGDKADDDKPDDNKPDNKAADNKKDPGLVERQTNLRELRRRKPEITSTLIMRELSKPRPAYIHLSGDFLRKGIAVSPGTPAVFPPVSGAAPLTRLDLARWLVTRDHPLTARVTVNRVWQAYFGKGIVETENDFGTQGATPSHAELLDWLAVEFMDRGWSMKALHRLIVTSAAYRQSSKARQELTAADPYNRLLGRQNRFRLDAEIVRDAALTASGLLAPAIGGPSVFPPIPDGAMSVTQVNREWKTSTGADRYRRGMYTFFYRSAPHPALTVFDAPDGVSTCTRRNRSNTPLQALTLLNDEAFLEFAKALGARLLREASTDDARIARGLLLTVGRPPTPRELVPSENDAPRLAAWTAVGRVLLNLDDFLTRE